MFERGRTYQEEVTSCPAGRRPSLVARREHCEKTSEKGLEQNGKDGIENRGNIISVEKTIL